MPLFLTDEELESLRSNDNNVTFIVSKADSFITNLQRQLETVKAQSEASSITAEQTCSLVEQKYISLSSDFEKLESQNAELNAAIERNLEELAVVKSEKHRIHLESIKKDGTIERLWARVSEIHKSGRELLEIVNLAEAAALKQSQLHEREAEFARSQATCARLSQRKFENLTKEKEEWTKEKQTLVKQEESRQGKRPLGDTSSEQAMKEKEARIQILERTIEREREELRKEKEEHRKEKEEHLKEKEEHHKEKEKHLKEKEEHRKEKEEHRKEKAMRLKSQRIFEGFLNRANQERAKLVDELERHKQVCRQESGVVETASCYKAVDNLNESVKSFISDDLGAPDHALDTSRTDRPAAAERRRS